MQYFDEMNNVQGFNDGNSIPLDAEECRIVYIRVINILLARSVSDWRLMAYNRIENNRCIMMRVPKDFVDGTWEVTDGLAGFKQTPYLKDKWELDEPDAAFHNSIAIARKMNLDGAVQVRVNVIESILREFSWFASEGNFIKLSVR